MQADKKQSPSLHHVHLLLIIAGLYLVQGIPMGLIFQAYPAFLREAGVSLEKLSIVPMAMLPWFGKIFWASWVENHWSDRFGRRKSWILPMQAIQTVALLAIAIVTFRVDTFNTTMALVAVVAIASTTQDIATDGLAADRLHGSGVAYGNILQVGAFMTGMLIGGPSMMVIASSIGQTSALLGLACLTVLCTLPVLLWKEPEPILQTPEPAKLRNFFLRPRAWTLLMITTIAMSGDAVTFALGKLILIDAGWDLAHVGLLAGTGNALMVIGGSMIAAWLLPRLKTCKGISLGLGLVGISSVIWLLFIYWGKDHAPDIAWIAACFGGVGIGMTTSSIYTLLMRYVQEGNQPATDFSMFQGVQNLNETLFMAGSTAVAAITGYDSALIIAIVFVCISLLLIQRA